MKNNSYEVLEAGSYSTLKNDLKKLEDLWECEQKQPNPKFRRCVFNISEGEIVKSAILLCISNLLSIVNFVFVYFLYKYFMGLYDWDVGLIICLLFVLTIILMTLSRFYSVFILEILKAKVTYILTIMIQQKILRIKISELTNENIAAIINSVSSDLEILALSPVSLFLFSSPITITCCTAIVIWLVGPISLIGVLISILHIPLILVLLTHIIANKNLAEKFAESRVFALRNFVDGIRILKMHGWDKFFVKKLKQIRKNEIIHLKKSEILKSFMNSFSLCGITLSIFATFISFKYIGKSLDYGESLLLINCLFFIQVNLSYILLLSLIITSLIIQLFQKLQKVLEISEFKSCHKDSERIILQDFSASWSTFTEKLFQEEILLTKEVNFQEAKDFSNFHINDFNIQIDPGELIMITGEIGSGKSAFLLSLLSEIDVKFEKFQISSDAAYYSEDPWILSGSIKENILMGRKFSKGIYKAIVSSCCLIDDIKKFDEGDNRFIEDNGHTISGGQKARIALARVLYSSSKVFLLDDPFSSLDPVVANSIFHNAILHCIKDSTRIMVCRNPEFFQFADKILCLHQGKNIFFGSPAEYFSNRDCFQIARNREIFNNVIDSVKINAKIEGFADISKEKVKFNTYYKYFELGFSSVYVPVIILAMYISSQMAYTGFLYWSIHWANEGVTLIDLAVYLLLVVCCYFLINFRILTFVRSNMKSCERLHNAAIKGLSETNIEYFDDNSTGKIVNRLSKDITTIDGVLQHYIIEFCNVLFPIFGAILVIVIVQPYSLIPFFLVVVEFILMSTHIIKPSNYYKKLEISKKGPIISLISTSLTGLPTIRSLNLEDFILKNGRNLAKDYLNASLTSGLTLKFFEFYMELGLCFIIISNIMITTYANNLFSTDLMVLSISISITLNGISSTWFWIMLNFDNCMVSCQNLFEISRLPKESCLAPSKINLGNILPSIQFEEVVAYYKENLILDKMSFNINAMDKVGIIGRTGAGKSTIFNLLLRIIQPTSGTIKISGRNYQDFSLTQLRSTVSILTQSSLVFVGSLRENLDPLLTHDDQTILQVLKDLRLDEVLAMDLDNHNFYAHIKLSSGEKQLLNFARILLKDTKISLIDEATSNSDEKTQKIFLKTVKKSLKNRTVLIIAHKLEILKHCHYIFNIENGIIKEIENYKNLCERNLNQS